MKFVHKLCYIALGGFLFALGTIISPIIAERTKFGEVECTKLTVVNRDGDPVVVLSAGVLGMGCGEIHVYGASHGIGGSIAIHHGQEIDTSVWIHADIDSSFVVVGPDRGSKVWLSSHKKSGGSVVVNNKNGSATMEVDEYGGRLDVRDTGKYGKSLAGIGINKYGNGVVQTWKKNGEPLHTLGNPIVLPHVDTTSDVIESKV